MEGSKLWVRMFCQTAGVRTVTFKRVGGEAVPNVAVFIFRTPYDVIDTIEVSLNRQFRVESLSRSTFNMLFGPNKKEVQKAITTMNDRLKRKRAIWAAGKV